MAAANDLGGGDRLVRVAAVNDYEIIVAGVAAMLRQFPDRLEVVDQIIVGEPLSEPVDVALYDTYGRRGIAETALAQLAAMPEIARIAIFSLDLNPKLVAAARAAGAYAFISKALPAEAIADAIVQVARGEDLFTEVPHGRPALAELDWPGKDDGLTERESQVLVLAAEGLSNQEIAAALYLGRETVKSYLSEVYAKLRVRNRVEAARFVRDTGAFNRYQPTARVLEDA